MANNWRPPSAKSAGWVPRGQGWKGFGQGLAGGLQNFANQWLAIKQYEREKEEKRQEQIRREALARGEALAKQRKEQQQLVHEYGIRLSDRAFQERMKKEEWAHQERIAGMKGEKEPKDLIGEEAQKHIDVLGKLETPFAQKLGEELWAAWNSDDIATMTEIRKKAHMNRDLMSKVGEGEKAKPTRDAFNIITAADNLLRLAYKKSDKEMPVSTQQKLPLGTAQWNAARARAIEMIKAGRKVDAANLLKLFAVTQEEVNAIENEANQSGSWLTPLRGILPYRVK
jgi:hypothetical protein